MNENVPPVGPERRCGPGGAGALVLLLVASLGAGGCSPGYVLRAAYEEARILCRREPIERLLAGDLDPEVRGKLELTLEARRFAAENFGLAVGGSYATFAEVGEDQVVHVVSAAPRERLELRTWWFPIVGRVPYRGYFDRAAALSFAAELEGEGYDTTVRRALAFSTLGWFADPLPSSVLASSRVDLAETIFHELLHNSLYVPGQGAFNESFATFVGWRGASVFFASRGEADAERECDLRWREALDFSAFLAGVIERLESAYARGIDAGARAELFRSVQAEFRSAHAEDSTYRSFASTTLNNAVLLHYRLYTTELALFEEAYQRNRNDLKRTIEWVAERARGERDPFAALKRG